MERLEEVIIKTKRLVKGNNGYSEIVHEFGGYKKFSKHCVTYTGIVNKIYEAYKSLEMITIEIEKVCALYFNAFCKERVRFSCSDFHKRVFMKYFYNDPWVKVIILKENIRRKRGIKLERIEFKKCDLSNDKLFFFFFSSKSF